MAAYDALETQCPHCGADKNQACKRKNGTTMQPTSKGGIHKARIRAWLRDRAIEAGAPAYIMPD